MSMSYSLITKTFLSFVLSVVLLVASSSSSSLCCYVTATISNNQFDALLQFKSDMNCSNAFTDWNSTKSSVCSTWSGITCNADETSVIGISLPGSIISIQNSSSSSSSLSGCSGFLSSSLSYIPTLEILDLSAPLLSSGTECAKQDFSLAAPQELPSSWSALSNLKTLNITCQTSISGSIPTNWMSGMTNLQSLTLSHLALNSTFSAASLETSNPKKLMLLDLSYNLISDRDLSAFSNLTNLLYLDLSNNNFKTLRDNDLSQLTKLETLLLDSSISFDEATTTFSLPQSFSGFSNLKNFSMNHVHALTGSIPESYFENWRNSIQSFSVTDCSLNGELSNSIGKWGDTLRFLKLDSNAFTGSLPKNISKLVKLEYLDVSSNQFSGSLDQDNFWLVGSQADGPVWISLYYNQITGPIPQNLYKNTKLALLFLQYNQFTGSLPSQLPQQLQIFLASKNLLSGILPNETYSDLPLLNRFDISLNEGLTGPLPKAWANWPKIAYFNVQHTSIDGELPAEYSRWNQSISAMFFSSCLLTGKIPSSWANLEKLTTLDLSKNCLTVEEDTVANLISNKLFYFDITPSCLDGVPPLTFENITLAGPYLYRRVRPVIDNIACPELYNAKTLQARLTTVSQKDRQVALSIFGSVNGFLFYLQFYEACAPGLIKIELECQYSKNEFFSVDDNISSSTQQLVPCSDQDAGRTFTLPDLPAWNNVTNLIPPLPEPVSLFQPVDVRYLYGVDTYKLKMTVGINDWQGNHKRFILKSRFLEPAVCPQNTSVAIPLTTNCAPCNPQMMTCNGTTEVRVAQSTSVWRYSSSSLPFYDGPCRATKGCVSLDKIQDYLNDNNNNNNQDGEESSNNNNDDLATPKQNKVSINDDGSGCMPNYHGPFCQYCDEGFGFVAGECVSCPSRSTAIVFVIICLCVFIVALGVLVYVSVDLSKYEDNTEEDACDRCIDYFFGRLISWGKSKLKQFDKYKPILERLIVTVRQLINHFSLLGALSNTRAAVDLSTAVKSMLHFQQSANNFAFGTYGAGASCLAKGSVSGKDFDLMIDVLLFALISLSVIFLIWFRRVSVAVTVALFLCHLMYAPLTEASAKLLALCEEYVFYPTRIYLLSDHDGSQSRSSGSSSPINTNTYDGEIVSKTIRLLSSDYSQSCDDDYFEQYRIGGWIVISLYSICFPLLVILIYKILTYKGKVAVRDEIFTFLTKHYKPEAWWYETVLMGRKLAVALIIGVLPNVSALQLQLFSFLCAIMLALSVKFQPLSSVTANNSDQLSIASALVCVTLISLSNTFGETNESIRIFVAVGIILTQIIAIVSIVLFGGSDAASDEKLFDILQDCCGDDTDKNDDQRQEDAEQHNDQTERLLPASTVVMSESEPITLQRSARAVGNIQEAESNQDDDVECKTAEAESEGENDEKQKTQERFSPKEEEVSVKETEQEEQHEN